MKTIKSLTEAEIAELPPLPMEWKWVRLGEIHILKSDKYKGSGESLFYVGLEHINKDQGTLTEDVKVDVINTVKNSFKKGDLLYGKLRPYLNKVYLANEDGVCSTDILVFESTPSLNLNYSKYFFLSYKFVNDMTQNSSGVNLPRVSTKYLQECPFPLAPLPEQRAIVSKIEQLFSELDNGISNLKLAQEQLKVYRQAVLKKAFEGELTKKWREQQTDLPDAGDLLEQIKKDREEDTKISGKKTNKIKSLTDIELAELPKLPSRWIWAVLGEVIDNIQAGKSIKCDERPPKSSELGIVKVSSVSWGEFNENESKTCFSEEAFNADYIIHKNDFLFSRANTIELVGACVIVKSINKRLMLSDKILKIDFLQNHNNFYSLYYLRSVFGRKEIESLATGNQESMRNIGQDRIKQIKIPICSLPEQQAIVQEIETRLSVCDKIEQDIETNLEKAEALRQSILKKAFEGKLLNERELAEVRGAEDWEPAEVLLERIKAEKVGNVKKEKQATEQLKSIIQDDKRLIQQATLEAFEQIDK